MRQLSDRPRRGTVLCLFAGAFLLVLVVLSTVPPTTGAVEGGENVTVYRASNVSFESAEAVEVAIANGTVESAGTVAFGDVLVVGIESERLADTMNATNGSTTARFFTAFDGDAEFRIIQTNPTPMKNRKFAEVGPENVTVHRNGTTAYAVVETGDLTFKYRRVLRVAEIFPEERFAVQFGYDLPDTWSRSTVPDSPIIEFQPRSQLTTEQSATTTPSRTTSETTTTKISTVTQTRTESETSTSGTPSTTRERGNTTEIRESQTGTPGVPGFTVLTTLGAVLLLAIRWTRRS